MRAAWYNLVINQAATFSQPFKWTNKDGTVVNLTDLDFEVKFKTTRNGQVFLEGFYEGSTNTPSGDIVVSEGGAAGTFAIALARGVTKTLDFKTGFWYLEIANVLNTFRVLEGSVTLQRR